MHTWFMVSVHGSDMQYGFPVNEFVTDYIKLPNNRPESEWNQCKRHGSYIVIPVYLFMDLSTHWKRIRFHSLIGCKACSF